MPPSREPDVKELFAILQAEAKRDAPLLAASLFPKPPTGSHHPPRGEFLQMVRDGWLRGTPNLPPSVWRAQLLQRYGAERMWQILFDAGLTTVKDPVAAATPPKLTGPQVFQQAVARAIMQTQIEQQGPEPVPWQ